VPFVAIAGEEKISPFVLNDHFNVPVGFIAYNVLSIDPIYTVPSFAMAGEERT